MLVCVSLYNVLSCCRVRELAGSFEGPGEPEEVCEDNPRGCAYSEPTAEASQSRLRVQEG